MLVTPLQDKIIVARDEVQNVTDGGVIIPDTAKKKAVIGTVEAVGPGRPRPNSVLLIPMNLRVGDRVIFGQYAGTELKIAGRDCLIMVEDDVLGVVSET